MFLELREQINEDSIEIDPDSDSAYQVHIDNSIQILINDQFNIEDIRPPEGTKDLNDVIPDICYNYQLHNRIRRPRRIVILTDTGQVFQKMLYKLIKNKKSAKVQAKWVIKYHNQARNLVDDQIRKVIQAEKKNINLYFNNHSFEMNRILAAISKLQDNGTINYGVDSSY